LAVAEDRCCLAEQNGEELTMVVDLSPYFDQFIENVSLGDPQVPRMDRAVETVTDFLRNSYGIGDQEVSLQGSYPNGTAVEPIEGGEYDVDIVAVCVAPGVTCNSALNDLEKRFKADGRFEGRVKRKKPCVRLEYAEDDVGHFHIDVVPTRISQQVDCPLEAPRRDDAWHGTAPIEYTDWCLQQGPHYARTVKAMKRWRDEHQSVRTAIKSIVLQVLIAQFMSQVADDGQRLAWTMRSLYEDLKDLADPPVVRNPVLPTEDLAVRWTRESFRNFVGELAEAVEWADMANQSNDYVEAADAWREILGDDFPILSPEQLGFSLSDYSHAQEPAAVGWSEDLDARYAVKLSATLQRGKRSLSHRKYESNGHLIFADHKLHFRSQVIARNHVDVWWQVANTGGHARSKDGLRGEIFRGRDLDGKTLRDQKENWENTAYTGSHLTRAMLVRNQTVVARSQWFQVNVYSNAHGFAR
jgi:hypothetical protein